MRKDGETLLSNSFWSLLNQITRIGSLAIVLIALSRHFGPERFGALAFGLAFVRIFAVITAFGLERILVRHFVESTNKTNEILRSAFRLKLSLGVLSYTSLLAIVVALDPHDRLTITIVALAGVGLLFQAFDVFDYLFQAGNRFRLTFLGRTLPVLLSTGLKLGAIFLGAPLLVFAGLETVEAASIAAALFLIHRATHDHPQPTERIGNRGLLREGFPLLVGALAVMLYMRTDILLLGKFAGYQAAGIYSAAAQVTEACALFPMAFMPALFPLLVRWRKQGPLFYRQQFEKLFLGAVLTGFAIALCLTITAPLVIRWLYGAAYASAAGILAIHAWSALFIYLSIMQSGYDITEGLTWIAAWRTGAGAALNILLNLTFIPCHGAAGSALATVISQFCSSFLFNFVTSSTRPIFWMQLRAGLLLPLVRAMIKPQMREAPPDNRRPLPV
ncbi:MAG TPA: flippase [Chthoniobacterales bacterium]|jgi:PST family polysaccharide transporter